MVVQSIMWEYRMVKPHSLLQVKDFFRTEYKYGENRNLFFFAKFHPTRELFF